MKIAKYVLIVFLGCFIWSCESDTNTDTTTTIDPNDPTAANKLGLGASANDLLSDDEFSTLRIEIIIDDDVQTSTAAISALEQFLEDRTFKTNVIITQREIPSPGLQPYSIQEVREIEDANRLAYNTDNEIAVSVLYLAGSSENDEDDNVTLGTAYRNTSIVIYKGTINRIGAQVNTPPANTIEEASLKHEFGHLFGLVNIGSPLQSEHEDAGSRGHCNVDGCLMVASIEFGMGMLGMSTVPEIDAQCIADLQANGGR